MYEVYDLWNILEEDIKECIKCEKKFLILKIDNNYKNWCNLILNDDINDDYRNSINLLGLTLAECIGITIYNENYKVFKNFSLNEIYIYTRNGTIMNLIKWKYIAKNKVVLRYGAYGFVNYIYMKIKY